MNLAEIDSTNAFLLKHAAALPDGTIATAEVQTAGRGRQGRRWSAPRGSSVLLSALLHEPAGSVLHAWATLVAALAVRDGIAASTECRPTLRWPNDLVVGRRKLAGVLAESAPFPAREPGGRIDAAIAAGGATRALVIGIGVNCLQQRGHFSAELAEKATSLEIESQKPVARTAVAAAILRALDAWLTTAAAGAAGREQLRSAWRSHCQDIGNHVRVTEDGRAYSGTVLDINDEGDLILQLDEGGRRHFGAAITTRAW
ncbi:MAG: biotin--[acetyl-CoA-carboxylase] ligase [Phycisphaerae bacterium]